MTFFWRKYVGSLGPATGFIVRAGARRGDDDLGPMTDRTGRVEGHAVTASSRGVRGRPSTSKIQSTLHLLDWGYIMTLVYRGLPTSHLLYRLGSVLLPHHTIRTPPYPMIIMFILIHHLHHMIHMQMLPLCLSVSGPGLQLGIQFFEQLVASVWWTHRTATLTMEPLIVAIPYLMLGQASRVDAKELSGCCLSVSVLPPSWCTDDYMPWFLPRTHPRIQNPERLPRGIQLPTATPITLHVVVDMIYREVDRNDIDDATKICRISDMIKKYNQPQR
ncbi:hypothetical protein M9H77_07131 [Catharanthus roseus]|uniref:Uncharacterized protein n=1 Tax=Catharanthus roseus TaxID=4058 RepID=A0ACC0BUB8_CATRO|nr:hypothetical protein M9H77_07131 [Catharanthus roseus]